MPLRFLLYQPQKFTILKKKFTKMIHIPQAILLQAAVWFFTGSFFHGAIFAAAFFIGREIAQAEHRTIQANYGNHRDNMPWWGGFEFRAWNAKSLFDFLAPAAVVFLIAVFVGWFF